MVRLNKKFERERMLEREVLNLKGYLSSKRSRYPRC
jgi:hypothetical protein